MVKNPSTCQYRRHRFHPWNRKIPHVAKQVSQCATTSEHALQTLEAKTTEPQGPRALWKWRSLRHVQLFRTPWISPGQNTEVGSLSLLQGIVPTQGSNPRLLLCGQILYQLSHKGSPRILRWIAYHFSRESPDPGIELGSPALQADSLPTELSGKPVLCNKRSHHNEKPMHHNKE